MSKKVLLISLYELGRQSFGVASAAAHLEQFGAQVSCQDLAITALDNDAVLAADLVAIHLPMHTATRIAVPIIQRIRTINPRAGICCFGLYAPLNAKYLSELGVADLIGGEFETGLVELYERLLVESNGSSVEPVYNHQNGQNGTQHSKLNGDKNGHVQLPRQQFQLPQRGMLPSLEQYAWLDKGDEVQYAVGYTETTRGCRHLCRHCPVVPVYNGALRVVQKEIVLADIRQQVEMGAQHITFGDPDFLNGPGHSLPIVEALHEEFPSVTFDVTIKVEHLLRFADDLPRLKQSGCLFIISAVESFDDHVLNQLEKGHTFADFKLAYEICRKNGIYLQPTFVAFHPWLSLEGYVDFLRTVAELTLVEAIAPIQYAIRLLIPAQSRLLELEEIQACIGPFDEELLVYPWANRDPRLDDLQLTISNIVEQGEQAGESRHEIFYQIWMAATALLDSEDAQSALPLNSFPPDAIVIPKLSEHWYC